MTTERREDLAPLPVYDVVIADDDPSVRDALAGLFADHPGLRVVGAVADGTAAADICSVLRPHVAVVDVMMPAGGVEAVEAVLAVSPGTIVVAYTARFDRRTRERLQASGATAVFAKGGAPDLAADIYALMGP